MTDNRSEIRLDRNVMKTNNTDTTKTGTKQIQNLQQKEINLFIFINNLSKSVFSRYSNHRSLSRGFKRFPKLSSEILLKGGLPE